MSAKASSLRRSEPLGVQGGAATEHGVYGLLPDVSRGITIVALTVPRV